MTEIQSGCRIEESCLSPPEKKINISSSLQAATPSAGHNNENRNKCN